MQNRLACNNSKCTSEMVDALVKELLPVTVLIENDFSKGVALYGAGFLGTWAVQYLRSIGANVCNFIDKDPQKTGSSIHGIPIVMPDDSIASSVASILITARHAVKSIQSAYASKKINLISFDGYYVSRNIDRLKFVRDNYFNDDKSKETFNAILIAMLTGSTQTCRDVMVKDMYFCLPEFSGTFDEIFLDAGAFVGDSVERFIWENLGTFRHLYAFEPGPKQFSALQQRMQRLTKEWAFSQESATIVHAGIAAKNGQMSMTFSDDFPLRHGLDVKDNSDSIKVYSLDSYLNGKPVTFIKADIEGMEMDLLRGAQDTIRKYKPKMTICVYHYPSDLHEVAEYIRNLVPEYQFRIRQHAPLFGDFVLYCHCP